MGHQATNLPPVNTQILSVMEPGEEYTYAELKRSIREKYGRFGSTNFTSYLTHLHKKGVLSRTGFKFFVYKLKENE